MSLVPDAPRYRIDGLIGRGGMGSVYRAHDAVRGCDVAWKRLDLPEPNANANAAPLESEPRFSRKTVLSSETRQYARRRAQLIALFQREYHTLAQLAHPRIIEVYDYGVLDGLPYYTMELLEGRDLSKAGPVAWQRACSILRDVASALTLLHARRMLHRDVSPRNVLCSANGHVKLIDFGAMTPMGLTTVLVGTPAFVAPEAVQRQALDARSDLYSLGALAYWLLSGRPPYLAHAFAELRDAYRTRPLPPSTYAPDVPSALDALVMQLIQIDRAARPGSAVELVERLGALAGLEHDPRLAVAGAYLSTPTLVGRQTELLAVRRRALRAQRGHGASMLAFGPSGIGRSRFLDACALEGKLAGALVLRADATAAGGAEYGVMRSLLTQVHAALSHAERAAHELPRHVRDQLVPGLRWTRASGRPDSIWPAPALDDDAAVLTQALHEYFVRLAAQRALMILIDDFHAIDGHSAAVIAGLGQATIRCKLVLVAGHESQATPRAEAALRLLEQYSRPLPLGALQSSETELLLRSVFGNVPNLAVVSNRLHGLSAGNPSLCMELARHLIDSGVVRYQAGGFILPERLLASDLPDSLEQVLQRRFDRLSQSARELGATLALCAGAPLTVAQCLSLTGGEDPAERQRALAELVAAETVVVSDDYLSLRQSAFGAALLAGLSVAQVKTLHARAAVLLSEEAGLRVRAAEHFLRADQPEPALEILNAAARADELFYEWFVGYDALIESAIAACERLDRPPRDAFMLRRGRAYHRMQYLERCDTQQLFQYGAELERMSGLSHYYALDSNIAPEQRLARAFELASADYNSTPERERIFSPAEAITELSSFLSALAGYGCATFDWELLTQMPSLAPYIALSPALELVERLCNGLRDLRAGRHEGYVAAVEWLLDRLSQPEVAGVLEARRRAMRLSVLFVGALTDGALGRARAFERAAELELVPRMRGNAWRVRQIAHLYRGDVHQADECRRQVELLLIQDNVRQLHQGTTVETEFMCYALSDDLLGLRRAVPELEHMAAQHPGWRPVLLLARAELERIRGRFAAAFPLYEQSLSLMQPGQHTMWPYAAGFYVQALIEGGDAQRAKLLGVSYAATCEQHRLLLLNQSLILALAQAEHVLGENVAALARVQHMLIQLEREDISGLYAGRAYELGAQVALALGDTARFAEYFERCSANYGSALDSPFTSRLARLRAKAAGSAVEQDRLHSESSPRPGHLSVERIRRELGACTTGEDRAERALALLMEVADTEAGYLYAVQAGKLVLCASNASHPPDARLSLALGRLLDELASCDADATEVVGPGDSLERSHTGAAIVGADGRVYTSFAIAVARGVEQIVAAVLVLARVPNMREPARETLAAIGAELFVRGDITGMTLLR